IDREANRSRQVICLAECFALAGGRSDDRGQRATRQDGAAWRSSARLACYQAADIGAMSEFVGGVIVATRSVPLPLPEGRIHIHAIDHIASRIHAQVPGREFAMREVDSAI